MAGVACAVSGDGFRGWLVVTTEVGFAGAGCVDANWVAAGFDVPGSVAEGDAAVAVLF